MIGEIATTWQMWATMAIIVGAIILYCYEVFPIEVTSIGLLALLLLFFQVFPVLDANGQNLLSPTELLKGFGNRALIAIIALLVVGQGLFQTGAFEKPTRWLLDHSGERPVFMLLAVFAIVMVISAFLNNTPVVVMFIPIIAGLAARSGLPASTVMMPLSFLCVLAGMTTLIGSSTNLLVADSFANLGKAPIGFFDFTIPGLFLAAIGTLYLLIVGPFVLPKRQADLAPSSSDGKQFIAQIELSPGHPMIGSRAVAGLFPDLPNMTVRLVLRKNETLLPPFDDIMLKTGDTITVAATRRTLTDFLSEHADYWGGLVGNDYYDDESRDSRDPSNTLNLIEAVVAPGSRMVGRTLTQIGFQYQTNCTIMGVQRRSRMIRSRMSEIRLQSGDVLLIFGRQSDVTALRSNRDVLLLEWSSTELPTMEFANRARLIFGGVILSAATSILPIDVAAVVGAAVMILSGCLNIRQAMRAVDQRILLLVASTLALGLALEQTGGAQFLAMGLVTGLDGYSTPVILSAFFLFVAAMTNVLSNNATAVLMTPIALSAATQLGVDPLIFIYTVIFAANCSFATPIAYQTNLLVMGPGHYVFNDYVRLGVPLLIIVWIAYTFFAPWYFAISW